ncbi:MAG: hypothetical protein JWN14_1393, partial [Chthonomonadales bacterium]|nr:hypothetical protein [Chthonomonadales bacterium]
MSEMEMPGDEFGEVSPQVEA